jgi:hypothetical protein
MVRHAVTHLTCRVSECPSPRPHCQSQCLRRSCHCVSGASSLVGLLVGLVDYVCLREAGAVVRRLASLRLLTDMLHLFPQDAVTQVRLDMG